MAQLSEDCFAFGGPMMSVDEAVGIIAAKVTAVNDIDTVPAPSGIGAPVKIRTACPGPIASPAAAPA